MRKLIFTLSATAALVASAAALAQESDDSRLAAGDTSAAGFIKLDSDADGRISAIEAANNSKVAAGFTVADADKDGYLSKSEYAQMARSSNDSGAAQPRSSGSAPEPSVPSDSSETAPQPR
jgi:hypothetical protein